MTTQTLGRLPSSMRIPKQKKAILVTGDRHWGWRGQQDWFKIRQVLKQHLPDKIIEGEQKGADRLSRTIADEMGISVDPMPANWEKYGPAAGPIRNKAMLDRLWWYRDQGWEVLVVAFHSDLSKSKGTANMVKLAQEAGLTVELIT